MKMTYGGFLPMSGTFTDKKTGKEIDWKNVKILLSADSSRAGLYKAPYSDTFISALKSIPVGVPVDVCFDFYGTVEKLVRIDGGNSHV